jgi:hypothetical protein
VLNAAPTEIVIEMSQELARQAGANDIVVQDATGRNNAASGHRQREPQKSVPLPAGLARARTPSAGAR